MEETIRWALCLAACLAPTVAGCAGNVGERSYVMDSAPSTTGTSAGAADTTGGGGSAGTASDGTSATTGGTPNATTGGSATGGTSGSTGSTGNTASTGADVDAGATGGDTPATGGDPTDACGDGSEALAPGLRISQVAVYQTIKIPVYESGSWVSSRIAQLVQGKAALVRVFVETLPGWSSHSVRGVLTLDNTGTQKQLTADLSPSGSSSDAQLGSTFNFDLAGADIGPSTQLSLALVESSCPAVLGSASDVRVPATGLQTLSAQRVGKLRIVVVPVDLPQGPAPDTSAAQLEDMRQALLAYYPLADVEITVRAPYTWSSGLGTSQGWPELLNALGSLRSSDRVSSDVYYYGLVTPANSLEQFCGFNGCTLGIANQVSQPSPQFQVGLGVGWVDERTYDTMVHEVGHTHGLGHAPCVQGGSISGVDRSFPDSEGDTGIWGWDLRDDKLHPPTDKDIMGYCPSTWIGDYHYKRLITRSQQVNQRAALRPIADERVWHSLILYGDGGARWGASTTGDLSGAPTETAYALDATGARVAEIEVVRVALSDRDDSFVYLPEPKAGWAALELRDQTLQLAEIATALVP